MKHHSFLLTAFAVAILALPVAVSCNKGNDAPAMGKGSFSVTDQDGNVLDEASLSWGGYHYDVDCEAYDIVMFVNDDWFKGYEQGWAVVDIDKQFCGEEQDLTQDLDGAYSLYLFTTNCQYRSGDFSSGTLLVSVDETKNTMTVKVDGIGKDGNHLKINWSGKAIRSALYLYQW